MVKLFFIVWVRFSGERSPMSYAYRVKNERIREMGILPNPLRSFAMTLCYEHRSLTGTWNTGSPA